MQMWGDWQRVLWYFPKWPIYTGMFSLEVRHGRFLILRITKKNGRRPCRGTLRTVGFSCASRERNHCEQPFDFPSSICEVRHTLRDVFDITSSYFAGNPYTAGSRKRSSYVAERTRKRQNKFTNSFYRFKFNLFVLGAGLRLTQRN